MRVVKGSLLGIAVLAVSVQAGLMLGCRGSQTESQFTTSSDSVALQTRSDQLKHAADYIFSDDRFDTNAFNDDVTKALNQWVHSRPQQIDWTLDPMVESWTEEVRQGADLPAIAELEFLPKDAQYLQLAAWTKLLADWLESQPQRISDFRYLTLPLIQGLDAEGLQRVRDSQRPLSELLKVRHPDFSDQDVDELALAWQLFDWSVRNIQLEELASRPSTDEIQLFALNASDINLAAAMGVPGPGYRHLPDQVMKFGKGDAWQRGRVFLAMLRSRGIDAAWIATRPEVGELTEAMPRLIVVSIGGQGFLFDPALGLPVPTLNRDGIATLAEARQEPRILTQLDVEDFELSGRDRDAIPYPIRSIDNEQLVLLIDASPVALSKRMKLVEQSLTGVRRLRLSIRPSEIADRLKETTGISQAILWDVPVLAFLYRKSFEQAVRFQNPRVGQMFFEEQLYEMPCPIKTTQTFRDEGGNESYEQVQYDFVRLRTARHRAIIGKFSPENRSDEDGAKQLLLTMRMSDDQIEALETDDRIRAAFGVEQAGPLMQERSTAQVIKMTLRAVRATAALWLGLAHYELGDPGSALKWFDQVDTFDEQEKWTDLTLYNRGRCNESLLKYPEAIRIFQGSRSPQQAGDAIRARMLQSILDQKPAAESEPTRTEDAPQD